MKLCTVCGVLTSRPGSQCTEHARQSNRSRHNALHGTRTWQRLSARVLRAWRGEHGDWCHGYQRSSHPAADLTGDHVVPLAAGGAPFDIGNCAVLCRSCNSTKGASEADRGSPHAGFALLEDLARHWRRFAIDEGGWAKITNLSAHHKLLRLYPAWSPGAFGAGCDDVGSLDHQARPTYPGRCIRVRPSPPAFER